MPGKPMSPEKLAEASVMRAAGYTIAAIAERVGVSVSTLNRQFKAHRIPKGSARAELVDRARADLMAVLTEAEIEEKTAKLIADDLALSASLRLRIAEALDHLRATNLEEAAVVMRAAAAYSTALKNTSDTLRRGMRTDRVLDRSELDRIPSLVVREVSDEEARGIRDQHAVGSQDDMPVRESCEGHES